ncbi:hypothetical protein P5P86_12220 [Nocardioides sp. BP30]|uniref:MmcQ/YjbR family DNA-binding protein n=1 Tax=Nocardioides sp. BP30 TaxID=3036374 RepID=UPI00246949CE|nr:hypothetical protein [Nocardioides sp. BP30]WGL50729.1 hypothetical protein P5P86_12220 [Nocardioides sp. BP30]
MATLDDVRSIATSLPEVVEGTQGHDHMTGWSVRGRSFVWERPLRQRDIADLTGAGERVPGGDIVGVRVAGADKEAVLASVPGAFHVPHFTGYPAVLVELEAIPVDQLREVITDGWIAQAPKGLAKAFLDGA